MPNRETIILFEPGDRAGLGPIAATRPVWELRVGPTSPRELLELLLQGGETVLHNWCRDDLAELWPRPLPSVFQSNDLLLLAGNQLLTETDALGQLRGLESGETVTEFGQVIAARMGGEEAAAFLDRQSAVTESFAPLRDDNNGPFGKSLHYWWEIFETAPRLLDWLLERSWRENEFERVTPDHWHMCGDVRLAPGVKVAPGVVLDGREKPILLDRDVEIGASATLIGPCYLGPSTRVKPQSQILHGSFTGPQCRLGGEIEETQFQGFSNKQHHGFLGHAVVGEWVNIGAGATNSDLKNNYTEIAVSMGGKVHPSGRQFVGSCLGDHVKIAIQSRLNTGAVIAPFCNWFGAGFPPKELPAFIWGGDGVLQEYDSKQAFFTAKRAMNRRNVELTPALESLYMRLFEKSRAQREALLG